MVAIKLWPGGSTFNISAEVLDPYYLDLPEGDSFWTDAKEIDLCLPFKDWPKPDLSKPKEVTRWRYTDEVENGKPGFRIKKLKYNET